MSEPACLPGWEAPPRHTITVNGIFLRCTCRFSDYAGAPSIYNHALRHGGAYVEQRGETIWVDDGCRVEGDQIVRPSLDGTVRG